MARHTLEDLLDRVAAVQAPGLDVASEKAREPAPAAAEVEHADIGQGEVGVPLRSAGAASRRTTALWAASTAPLAPFQSRCNAASGTLGSSERMFG